MAVTTLKTSWLGYDSDTGKLVFWNGSRFRPLEESAGYATVGHTHAIDDVSDLQTALDAKLDAAGGTISGALSVGDTLSVSGIATFSSGLTAASLSTAGTVSGAVGDFSGNVSVGGVLTAPSVDGNMAVAGDLAAANLTTTGTLTSADAEIGGVGITGSGGDLFANGQRLWSQANDGSGSGLDADHLDGEDSGFYTDIPARLGYTPFNAAGGTIGGNATVDGTLDVTGNLDVDGAEGVIAEGAEGSDYQIRPALNATTGVSVRAASNPIAGDNIFTVEPSGNQTRFGVTQSNGGWFRDGLRVGEQWDSGMPSAGNGLIVAGAAEIGGDLSAANLSTTGTATAASAIIGTTAVSGDGDEIYVGPGSDKVWHQGNHGSGSGLDADQLDGQDSGYYTDIPARLGYTPFNAAGGTIGGNTTVDGAFDTTGAAAFGSSVTADAAVILTGAGGFGRVKFESSSGPLGLEFTGTANGMSVGFRTTPETFVITSLAGFGGGDVLTVTRAGNLTMTGEVTAASYNAAGTMVSADAEIGGTIITGDVDDLYVDGSRVWHQGNDGAGSGLDADQLDGQDSSYYRNASNINAGTLVDARLNGHYTQIGHLKSDTLRSTRSYPLATGADLNTITESGFLISAAPSMALEAAGGISSFSATGTPMDTVSRLLIH